jgi:hypothetical protein
MHSLLRGQIAQTSQGKITVGGELLYDVPLC